VFVSVSLCGPISLVSSEGFQSDEGDINISVVNSGLVSTSGNFPVVGSGTISTLRSASVVISGTIATVG
jgi:hypothetical protein